MNEIQKDAILENIGNFKVLKNFPELFWQHKQCGYIYESRINVTEAREGRLLLLSLAPPANVSNISIMEKTVDFKA